jgi:hypothetical protein
MIAMHSRRTAHNLVIVCLMVLLWMGSYAAPRAGAATPAGGFPRGIVSVSTSPASPYLQQFDVNTSVSGGKGTATPVTQLRNASWSSARCTGTRARREHVPRVALPTSAGLQPSLLSSVSTSQATFAAKRWRVSTPSVSSHAWPGVLPNTMFQ